MWSIYVSENVASGVEAHKEYHLQCTQVKDF